MLASSAFTLAVSTCPVKLGMAIPAKTPMIAITIKSSISVKPFSFFPGRNNFFLKFIVLHLL